MLTDLFFKPFPRDGFQGYEIRPIESDSLVVKEMILPGAQGFPPMYIRYIRFNLGEPILIVSQTDYELDDAKKREIVAGAIEFLNVA